MVFKVQNKISFECVKLIIKNQCSYFRLLCAKKVSFQDSDNQIGLDGRMRWVKSPESNYFDNELMRFTFSECPRDDLEMRKTALM